MSHYINGGDITCWVEATLTENAEDYDVGAIVRDLTQRYDILGYAEPDSHLTPEQAGQLAHAVDFKTKYLDLFFEDQDAAYWAIVEEHEK